MLTRWWIHRTSYTSNFEIPLYIALNCSITRKYSFKTHFRWTSGHLWSRLCSGIRPSYTENFKISLYIASNRFKKHFRWTYGHLWRSYYFRIHPRYILHFKIPLYIASNCSINRKKNSLNLISGQFPVNLSVPKWYWIPSILI